MSCPVIDISPLVRGEDSKRMLQAAAELTAACHRYGFASLVGHGVPENLRKEAFKTLQDLFSLSHEQKMQAPHPPSAVPHRGYSSPGLEKVYGTSDLADVKVRESNGEALRKITDLKVRSLRGVRIIVERNIHLASISQESYEVGSEHNRIHGNIWLPEATLPGFRKFTTDLFWELSKLGRYILEGLATGLKLSEQERSYLFEINSGHNNQLRLLHYPSVPSELVDSAVVARMPAHTDWSLFTMVFQDEVGGLELEDPQSPGVFIPAKPVPDSVVINIGDMLMRLSNGYFNSANHRVSIPPPSQRDASTGKQCSPERYSIPYFVAPDDHATIETFSTCIGSQGKRHYETLKFSEYADYRAKHSYKSSSATAASA